MRLPEGAPQEGPRPPGDMPTPGREAFSGPVTPVEGPPKVITRLGLPSEPTSPATVLRNPRQGRRPGEAGSRKAIEARRAFLFGEMTTTPKTTDELADVTGVTPRMVNVDIGVLREAALDDFKAAATARLQRDGTDTTYDQLPDAQKWDVLTEVMEPWDQRTYGDTEYAAYLRTKGQDERAQALEDKTMQNSRHPTYAALRQERNSVAERLIGWDQEESE